MEHTSDVVVIGGGISGLSAAYFLQRKGLTVTVIESAPRLGGTCHSVEVDGSLCELGPTVASAREPIVELIRELGLGNDIVPLRCSPLDRQVAHYGRLEPIPYSVSKLLTSPIISTGAKFGLLRGLVPYVSTAHDETVYDFFSRRFGGEITRLVFGPLLAFNYGSEIFSLSARSSLPKIWDLDRKSGWLALKMLRGGLSKLGAIENFFTLKNGFQPLIEKLSGTFPDKAVQLDTRAVKLELEPSTKRIRLETSKGIFIARRVILAAPADTTAEIIRSHYPALSAVLKPIPYIPLGVMHLRFGERAFRRPPTGFGFSKVDPGSGPLIAATYTSNALPNRTPSGTHLVTCITGGFGRGEHADIARTEIQQGAISELCKLMDVHEEPQILNTHYWERATPHYPLNHYRLVEELPKHERFGPEIQFLGTWRQGLGISDCVSAARELTSEQYERR